MKLTILLGCFNEKATILAAVKEAQALLIDKEIIVIDNASTDGTRELLLTLQDDKSLKIILNDKNYGTGYSAKIAAQMAKGEFFFAPGTDLEYRMADVLEMFRILEAEKLDMVFGSRLLGTEKTTWQLIKERPFWLGSILATMMINRFYGLKLTDVIAPKLIKTSILNNINLASHGHAREFELVSWLCKKGHKIGEIPVYYKSRTRAEGKTIRMWDIFPSLWAIIRVKIFG